MMTALVGAVEDALIHTGKDYAAFGEEQVGSPCEARVIFVPGPGGLVIYISDGGQDASIALTNEQRDTLVKYLAGETKEEK